MSRHLLLTVDAVGGVWPYAVDLAAGLRAHGWATTLALLGPAADADQAAAAEAAGARLVDTGLALDWMSDDAATVCAAGAALAALARAERADLVQLNQPALAAGFGGIPVVAAIHSCVGTWWDAVHGGPLPADLAWQAALTGEGLREADAVVAPTTAFARAVAVRYGVIARVVANGRAPLPAEAAPMRDVALTAGRLWDAGKDVATLDRAAARLAIPFAAAGSLDGPHGATVEPRHLATLGRLDDATLGAHLAARPVFVSAARYEPFGLAVLEAALAGCALVLSDIPTFRELWDGAATFAAPGDDAAFASAIAALIADPVEREAAGDRAHARASAARFTPAAMAAAMAAIYRTVLAAPARVAA